MLSTKHGVFCAEEPRKETSQHKLVQYCAENKDASVKIDDYLPEDADRDNGLDACAENEAQEGAECSLHRLALALLCYKEFCQQRA